MTSEKVGVTRLALLARGGLTRLALLARGGCDPFGPLGRFGPEVEVWGSSDIADILETAGVSLSIGT